MGRLVTKFDGTLKALLVFLVLWTVVNIGFVVEYEHYKDARRNMYEAYECINNDIHYFSAPEGAYYVVVWIRDYKDAEHFREVFCKYRPAPAPKPGEPLGKGSYFFIYVPSEEYREFVNELGGGVLSNVTPPESIVDEQGNMTYLVVDWQLYKPYDYTEQAYRVLTANVGVLAVTVIVLLFRGIKTHEEKEIGE